MQLSGCFALKKGRPGERFIRPTPTQTLRRSFESAGLLRRHHQSGAMALEGRADYGPATRYRRGKRTGRFTFR
jgi:hypothetical protein